MVDLLIYKNYNFIIQYKMSQSYLYTETPKSLKDILEKNHYWNDLVEKYPKYFEKFKNQLESNLTCDLSELKENPLVYNILKKECDIIIKYSNKFRESREEIWDNSKIKISEFPNCILKDCDFTELKYFIDKDYKTDKGCKIREIVDYCKLESEKINNRMSLKNYSVLKSEEMNKIIQILYRLKKDPNFKQDFSKFAYNINYSENKIKDIYDIYTLVDSQKGEVQLDLKKIRNRLYDSLSLIYILSKSKDVCVSNFDILQEEIAQGRKLEDIKLSYDVDTDDLYYNQKLINFLEASYTNPNCRIICVIIILIKDFVGHANLLLIDKVNKTVERFEPHGYGSSYFSFDSYFTDSNNIQDQVEKYNKIFEKKLIKFLHYNGLPEEYIFLGTVQSCPISGFQYLESIQKSIKDESKRDFDLKGYCLFWTYFYLEMRLKFPEFSRDELTEIIFQIFRFSKNTYFDFIRMYTQRLFLFSQAILNDCLQDRVTDLITLMECIKNKI
jgi:hypothetical protein